MTGADRYRHPPFDESGEHGPRRFEDCTVAAQHRYLNGPRYAHLLIFHVYEHRAGPWYASDDGREWLRREDTTDAR